MQTCRPPKVFDPLYISLRVFDVIFILGDDENLKEALSLILQKVVEDPQSGKKSLYLKMIHSVLILMKFFYRRRLLEKSLMLQY